MNIINQYNIYLSGVNAKYGALFLFLKLVGLFHIDGYI